MKKETRFHEKDLGRSLKYSKEREGGADWNGGGEVERDSQKKTDRQTLRPTARETHRHREQRQKRNRGRYFYFMSVLSKVILEQRKRDVREMGKDRREERGRKKKRQNTEGRRKGERRKYKREGVKRHRFV